MRYIFLGPPGAGKGTQANILASRWQIPHISTGDILRTAIATETPLGVQARTYVSAGELVPNDLIMALIRERFGEADTKAGWILDGFPRTIAQAQALDRLLSILWHAYPSVIYFKVDDGVLTERMLTRGRADDTAETIQRRLEVYHQDTIPLVDFYQKRRCLIEVDGGCSSKEVTQALQESILQAQSSPLEKAS
ncbi:MAG: adenylate kinase [Cyanobacteria bacterium J06641_5]